MNESEGKTSQLRFTASLKDVIIDGVNDNVEPCIVIPNTVGFPK